MKNLILLCVTDRIFVEADIEEDYNNEEIDNKETCNKKNKKYKITSKNIYEEIIKLKKDDENKNETKKIINNKKTLIKKDSIWFEL
jgi:hypothetical protein